MITSTQIKARARRVLLSPISPAATRLLGSLQWGRTRGDDGNDWPRLANARRILVVKLDNIGDVVLMIPFVRALRLGNPHVRIDVVVRPAAAELLETCPYINRLHILPVSSAPAFGPWARYLQTMRMGFRLRQDPGPDLVVIPRWDVDHLHATYLAYFTGARWRVGYSETVCPEKQLWNAGYDSLLTHTIHDCAVMHEIVRGTELARRLGAPSAGEHLELWLKPRDKQYARDFFENTELHGRAVVAVAPGAQAPKRRWPVARYRELLEWIVGEFSCRILLLGGYSDLRVADKLSSGLTGLVADAVGKTTLGQAAAMLGRCVLYIGSDSGPVHLAAAMGLPVVTVSCHPDGGCPLSGNAPERFRPWVDRATVLRPAGFRSPCSGECTSRMPHCILGVRVEDVQRAVAPILLDPAGDTISGRKTDRVGHVQESEPSTIHRPMQGSLRVRND
ncbi:MAG: glycosyltransferase family 9 protein [Gemmatimonadota bacterium]